MDLDAFKARLEAQRKLCAKLAQDHDQLSRDLDRERARLDGLELAASILGVPTIEDRAAPTVGDGGAPLPGLPKLGLRKKWELSPEYLRLVAEMVARGNQPMNRGQIATLANTLGLAVSSKQVGGRMRRYLVTGLAERGEHGYRISEAAICRLGLRGGGHADAS